jgi:hypothetical protein
MAGSLINKPVNLLPGATVTIRFQLLGSQTATVIIHTKHKCRADQSDHILYVGYENMEITVTVNEGGTANADAALNLAFRAGNEVVVAASKRAEKIMPRRPSTLLVKQNWKIFPVPISMNSFPIYRVLNLFVPVLIILRSMREASTELLIIKFFK